MMRDDGDTPSVLDAWQRALPGRRVWHLETPLIAVSRYSHAAPVACVLPPLPTRMYCLPLAGPAEVVCTTATGPRPNRLAPMSVGSCPEGSILRARWEAPLTTIQIHLSRDLIDGAGEVDHRTIQLPRVARDPFIWVCGVGLYRALRRRQIDRLTLDTVAVALAAHGQDPGGDTAAAAGCLDEHVALALGLGELADAAGLNRTAVMRSFTEVDAEALRGHLLSDRLKAATRDLLGTEKAPVAVAAAAGFRSVPALNLALWFAYGADACTYRRLNRDQTIELPLRRAS